MLRRGPRRRGAAMVEFAIVLPLLMMFLFGIIEFGNLFKIRLSAQEAAREGCRLAVLQSTAKPYSNSAGPVMQRIEAIMNAAGVDFNSSMVTIEEDSLGDPAVSISVTVPYEMVSMTGFFDPIASDLTGSCTMRKEGV